MPKLPFWSAILKHLSESYQADDWQSAGNLASSPKYCLIGEVHNFQNYDEEKMTKAARRIFSTFQGKEFFEVADTLRDSPDYPKKREAALQTAYRLLNRAKHIRTL